MNWKVAALSLIVVFAVGFFVGRKRPASIVEEQTKVISELRKNVKVLEDRSLNEKVIIKVVEKPDGTKITTKKSEKTESVRTIAESTVDIKRNEISTSLTKPVSLREIGLKQNFDLESFQPDTQVYLRAGFDCWIVTCFGEMAYSFSGVASGGVGLKVAF